MHLLIPLIPMSLFANSLHSTTSPSSSLHLYFTIISKIIQHEIKPTLSIYFLLFDLCHYFYPPPLFFLFLLQWPHKRTQFLLIIYVYSFYPPPPFLNRFANLIYFIFFIYFSLIYLICIYNPPQDRSPNPLQGSRIIQ